MKINYFIIPPVAVIVAVSGSLLVSSGMDWYQSINLPSWTLPGSVIGAIWTTVFLLATISALIIWNGAERSRRFWLAVAVFGANATLNVFWSFLFFNQHLIGASVIEAALLGASVIALMLLLWPLSRIASLLLVPYVAWVAFATYLAYAVLLLNP